MYQIIRVIEENGQKEYKHLGFEEDSHRAEIIARDEQLRMFNADIIGGVYIREIKL